MKGFRLHSRSPFLDFSWRNEGFSYLVTSIAAPVASGWSGHRVGLAPTGKRRILTHARSRQCRARQWMNGGKLFKVIGEPCFAVPNQKCFGAV
jgi:hypothetical protein